MTAAAFVIGLYGALWVGLSQMGEEREPWAPRELLAAGALFLLVAVPTVLQLTLWPGLQGALGRNRDEILRHGQVWRLATSLVVQDGGRAGAISNLLSLALLAPLAIRLQGVRIALAAFAAGALAGELAGLSWQPLGAGNSVGCCGLSAAILASAIASGGWRAKTAATIIALVAVSLVLARDIHGAAFAGALVTMALVERSVHDHAPRTDTTA